MMKQRILRYKEDLKLINSLLSRGWTFGWQVNDKHCILQKNMDRRRDRAEIPWQTGNTQLATQF